MPSDGQSSRTYQGDQEDSERKEVETGERFGYSNLTDTWYRVTAWIDHGDGQIEARSKEEVDREDVPDDVLDATMERVQR